MAAVEYGEGGVDGGIGAEGRDKRDCKEVEDDCCCEVF